MKKILAMMLTAAMMLSMGTAVFADGEGDQPYDGKLDAAVVLPKNYVVNGGVSPAEKFTYEFTPASYKDVDENVYVYAESTTGEGEEAVTTKTWTVTAKDGTEKVYTYDENTSKYIYKPADGDAEELVVPTIPAIANKEISYPTSSDDSFTAEQKNIFEIDPDTYALGTYTYEVNEIIPTPKTAGVTYSEEKLILVLTILRHEDTKNHYVAAMHYQTVEDTVKTQGFKNEYDAGKLEINKTIKGNMAVMDKEFTFTVILTPATGEAIMSDIVAKIGEEAITAPTMNNDGTWTYTFTLTNGEKATFDNIPEDVTYKVTENAENYTQAEVEGSEFTKVTTPAGNNAEVTGTIYNNETDTVSFTNELKNEVDTGISVDSIPYIAMLGVVAIGGTGFIVSKKRRSED